MALWTDRCPVRNHKTKSASLLRLLTQTIEAPKKRNRLSERQTHKKKKQKRMLVSKIEIKLEFPYVVPTQHKHRTEAYACLQYHYAQCIRRSDAALNLMWLTVGVMRHQQAIRVKFIFRKDDILYIIVFFNLPISYCSIFSKEVEI